MKYVIGDIAIRHAWPGHGLLCVEGGVNPKFIHATNKFNFKIDPLNFDKGGSLLNKNYTYFRAADKFALDDAEQNQIVKIAKLISERAKYGNWRAFRVFAGSSKFGSGAKKRLEKYRERLGWLGAVGSGGGAGKLVTTLTCCEAVILCYQLTFKDNDPRFIQKDAAHIMPNDFSKYLVQNKAFQTVEDVK